jgi:hypothetical protein
MILSVHQPQYLPWLGYFDKIAKSDRFVFLDNVQYKEREFQNRNKIRSQKGWMWLSVPAVSGVEGKQKINQVKIDNEMPWQRKHWGSLKTAYSSSDYFKEYAVFFEETYSKKWEWFLDLNVHIITYILKELAITTPISFASDLKITTTKTQRIIDICKKLNADTYLSGIGGKEYLEEGLFEANGIALRYQDFQHPVYRQQFMSDSKDFISHLSVVDLLFNQGPKAREILGLD